MRKLSILFLLVFAFIINANSQEKTYQFNDTRGENGYNLITSKSTGVEVIYSIKNFSIKETQIKGETMQNIVLPGVYLFNDAGMPDLPGDGRMIAIPEGSKPKLNIVDYKTYTIENVEMAPAPVLPLDTEDEMVYEKNSRIYSENKFYPENPIQISEVKQLRGVDFVTLGVTPFQYNPVTKQLIVYYDVKINIAFEGGKGVFGEDRLRNKWWEPILEDALLNYSSLNKLDLSKKIDRSKDGEYEYVIITLDNPDYVSRANTIAEFRRKQGISTGVFTISQIGGNTISAIQTWVDNAYNTWQTPPAAIMIMADYGTGTTGITSQSYPHPYDGTYISDNHYADVDNDDLPDIVFSRMAAQNISQLDVMISKFMNYEQNPPTSANFYNHPITALGWQTERWFQLCSETIGGFWKNELGKNPVRVNAVYDGSPNTDPWSTATNTTQVVNFFGPSGLNYIPASPSTLGGWTGGNATAVNNAINNGSFMLQHRDHGGEDGWGEPAYTNTNISGLTNTDLTFIMSINCLTGRFDYSSEVFAEKFHRYTYNSQNSGALGVLAATQVSYSFVNDAFVWGAYDNMWPDFMPSNTTIPESRMILPGFANVAGKNFLYQTSWPYNTGDKQITYRLFHLHGDAFLNVYSEVPQNLNVSMNDVHIFGTTSFDVSVDDDALIAITYFDDLSQTTKIIATELSIGGTTTLQLSECPPVGTNMLVTITKQNYYRYTDTVLVIAPAGPFLICSNKIVNDGNNGIPEYSESFNLDLVVKNVGSEPATNITATLTESDTYVSLTNSNNVVYSDLDTNETDTSSNYFNISVANNIDDGHVVNFNLTLQDSYTKAVYNSTQSLVIKAPKLSSGTAITVDDSQTGNNDGILDPGETGNLIVSCQNTGHADITNVIGNITCANQLITINNISTNPVNLNINETKNFIFNVTADASFGLGTEVDFNFIFTGGVQNQYADTTDLSIIVGFVPEYCMPTYSSGTSGDDFIDGVVLEGINNTNTGSATGPYYNDYTNMVANLSSGETYSLQITAGDYSGDRYAAWIDYNYNGSFDSNEKLGELTLNEGVTGTITFTVPAGIVFTNSRMRVICAWTSSAVEPCNNYSYGEIEDYSISFVSISAGTASVNNSNICVSGNAQLNLTGYVCDEIQWQKSTDNLNWEDIADATSNTYTTETITADCYYRAKVSKTNFDPLYSNVISISVFEQSNATFTYQANNGEVTFTNNSTNATSYIWNFGDNTSSTLENPVHTYNLTGEYTVQLTANNDACTDSYSENIMIVTGLVNLKDVFGIYPNPSEGTIFLNIPTNDNYIVTITNVTGKVFYNSIINNKNNKIELNNIESGIYIINIYNDNNNYTEKLIIK